jgi:hypothetical protein
VLQSVSTYVTEIDKNFAGSVGVLQGAIEALEDTLAAQAARNPDSRNG